MTPIDEAALKAGISDEEIVAFAKDFYERTEHGVKLNVPAFARALLSSHHEDGGRAATDKKSARDTALEQAACLVECEYAADATQGRRLAQIAQHIRDLKKRKPL